MITWPRPPTAAARWSGLDSWYQGRLGRHYAAAEAAVLEQALPTLFGHHALALGRPGGLDRLVASRINHRIAVDWPNPVGGGLAALPWALPFAADSLDLVVLPHVLECVGHPHAVLREIDRVLIPEGHCVVLGFNPASSWGVWRGLQAGRGRGPAGCRMLGVRRMRDWFALLGFQVMAVHYLCYRPPFGLAAAAGGHWEALERWGRRWCPSLGGGYVIIARKRQISLTPLRPRWQRGRRLLPGQVVGRASRENMGE